MMAQLDSSWKKPSSPKHALPRSRQERLSVLKRLLHELFVRDVRGPVSTRPEPAPLHADRRRQPHRSAASRRPRRRTPAVSVVPRATGFKKLSQDPLLPTAQARKDRRMRQILPSPRRGEGFGMGSTYRRMTPRHATRGAGSGPRANVPAGPAREARVDVLMRGVTVEEAHRIRRKLAMPSHSQHLELALAL